MFPPKGEGMSFGKIVALSMLAAFSAGAGYSYYADKIDLPMPFDAEKSRPTSSAAQRTNMTSQSAKLSRSRPYTLCSGSVRTHCVVDGDTLWHEGVKIRIADIDTPEVSSPKCQAEATSGAKATSRLLQLVNAGPFEVLAWEGRDEDKYGRKLRILVRDGHSLGNVLVSEGLARTWAGRRQPWC
jgi:endonuclease YncB( thermonuclease family)